MMVAYTDVLIDALRGRGAAERVRIELATGRLATTSITIFELLVGARTASERERVERLLAAMIHLPVDAPAAREAAAIGRDLSARGLSIGEADTLIAGVCRSRSAMLLSRNRAHFERVEGLVLATIS